MHVTETELFRAINILLLDRNKEHLDELKAKLSLISNIEMDNSGLLRAIVEYLYDHQELLPQIIPYATKYKGFVIHQEFVRMLEENKSPEDIEKELGISVSLIKELKRKKQRNENKKEK